MRIGDDLCAAAVRDTGIHGHGVCGRVEAEGSAGNNPGDGAPMVRIDTGGVLSSNAETVRPVRILRHAGGCGRKGGLSGGSELPGPGHHPV